MARVTVTYNASSGSDTAASGGGPSTAVTGTNGDISGSTLTLNETKDFTGAANDGTDVLYFTGNAGDRHLFAISSFTGGVSTCTALVLVETATATRTGSAWAVGGKRKTFQNDTSQPDGDDWGGSWDIVLEAGTYDVTTSLFISTNKTHTAGQPLRITGAGRGSTTLRKTTNGNFMQDAQLSMHIRSLHLTTNATTKTGVNFSRAANGSQVMFIEDCRVTELNSFHLTYFNARTLAYNCDFDGLQKGVNVIGVYGAYLDMHNCVIRNCGADGCVLHNGTGDGFATITNNVFLDNNVGIKVGDQLAGRNVTILNNIIHGSTSHGVNIVSGEVNGHLIAGNIITDNGGYGINCANAREDASFLITGNAFRGNTSGEGNNVTIDSTNITLTADPYTSESTDDYTLNNTAGGGALLRNTALPDTWPGLGTTNYRDVGPMQIAPAAGGGTTVYPRSSNTLTRM